MPAFTGTIAWGAVQIVDAEHATVQPPVASCICRARCLTTGLHKLDAAGQEVSEPFT